MPDLLQRPGSRRISARRQRTPRGRHAAVGLDRRRRNRLQLLTMSDLPVDVDVLREEIRNTYTDVSTDHEQEFIFPTGRAWAQELAMGSTIRATQPAGG